MSLNKLLIQEKPDSNTPHSFYVYFDEWHGNIISIASKKQNNIEYPYLLTTDPTVKDLMTGTKSLKKYVVAEDYQTQSYKIVLRDNYLRLKKAEEYLSKVSELSLSSDQDINIVAYLSDYKIQVYISEELFYKITGLKGNSAVHIENTHGFDDLKFYITRKNNPNILYQTISINPVDLVTNKAQLFDLSRLRTKVQLRDIDIYTKRVFKTYGLKVKHQFVENEFRNNKKRKHIYIQNKDYDDDAIFSVSPSTQGWIIRSNFENPHEYKIYNDLRLYLTGNNPNQLLDRIIIPIDKIGNHQEYIVQTQVDPATCKILVGEQGKNINFKFEEIEYVESGKY